MNRKCKRIFSALLCTILIFVQEAPAYAQGVAGLTETTRAKQEREAQAKALEEKEEALFKTEAGITLSQNQPEQPETAELSETAEDTGKAREQEALRGETLRMPEQSDREKDDFSSETLIETGRNYKIYALADGTYKTVYTAYPNTYMDGTEEKPIDNTLVSENGVDGAVYVNKENDMEVSLPAGENADHAVTVGIEETCAVLCPEDGNYTKEAVSENAIRYNDVYENVDVQYTVQPNGLKQDIILNAPQERNSFTYHLAKDGIRAGLEGGCICLYDEDAGAVSENDGKTAPVMVISAPRMEDAAGVFSDAVTLELIEKEDEYEIILTADSAWLSDPSRVYPVKIDPSTTVIKNQIVNYTISSLAGAFRGQAYSHAGFFADIGKTRSYMITDYFYESLAFPYPEKGVEILSAQLNIYQINDADGFNIGCYRLNQALPSANQTWDNTITLDRYAAGENAVCAAGEGWHSFDVRDSVNGWVRSLYKSHGLVLISDHETLPGAVFATENYPDASLTPTLEIIWQPAGDVPFDYSVDDTTVNLRPMTLTTTDGKMQCYGVFADGTATPGAYVAYVLSDSAKNYGAAVYTGNEKLYPDSSSFQSDFPEGTLGYRDSISNWQTVYPFTEYEKNTVYTIKAQAATAEKLGKTAVSDEFLIYQVTRYDTMQKIADYYGVPLATLLFDNKAADTLLVENNTLFIRNPQRNKNTPYQPSELTDREKAEIDSALLGRALHCEYGFEPINLNTGNFYLAQEDFSYTDSFGTFALQRSYNGLNAGRLGSFGRGFTSLFDESVSALSDGTVVYNREDGSSLFFRPDENGGYETPKGYQLSLKRIRTGSRTGTFSNGEQTYDIYRYEITREDQSICSFNETGNLVQIKGEDGSILTFNRDSDGRLTGVTREGVTMAVATTPEGMIASVTMQNGGTFRYIYDANQNLISVTDPLGGTKRFVYDQSHRMTEWYDENGTRVVKNTYDGDDRVISQTDETGGRITLRYEAGKTTAADAKGNTTVYEYDKFFRTTAIHYADGTAETKEYGNNLLLKDTDRTGVVTAFAYDGNGNITEKTVGNAHTSYTYNAQGKLTGYTDALGNTATAEYDAAGNLIKTTDAEGSTTLFTYDNRNRLMEQTDANGNRHTYSYSGNYLSEEKVNGETAGTYTYGAMGELLTVADGAGNTTSYTYDLLCRVTKVRYPAGGTQVISYDRTGLVSSVADSYGYTTIYTYDGSANIISVTDADGSTWSYAYDVNGNRIRETDPDGNVTVNEYDEMDRLVKVTDPAGGIYTYAYDGRDRLILSTDPDGGEMTAAYDPDTDLPLTVTDPEGIVTEYAYDAAGNVLSVTRGGEETAVYEYDAKGQPVRITYANGLTEMRQYDGNGNCILITDQNGRDLSMEYDAFDRLIRETTPTGRIYEYGYDGAGNLTAQTDPLRHTVSFTYDGNGNVLSQTDGEGNTTAYTYDLNDRLIRQQNPDGGQYRYVYDALGRVTAAADGLGYVTAYTYDRLGNLTKVTDPLGEQTTYDYDALGRLTAATDALGRTTSYKYDGAGDLISETDALGGTTTYTYDHNGRLTGETDALGGVTTYAYDALDRLTRTTDATGASRLYEYDSVGNLIKATDEKGASTEYTYDFYGNILTETDANGKLTTYTYSTENELEVVEDAEHGETILSYDSAGNITSVTDPLGNRTSYIYDCADRLIKERAADGGERSYTYDGVGNLSSETDSLHRVTAYTYDTDGNLTGVTDAAGGVTTYAYDPLGRVTSVTGADGSRVLAAYDSVGNLISTKEGEGNLTEYTYDALNRPVAKTDALGHKTEYTYDAAGNLIKETAPDGSRTLYAYDGLNRLTSMTLPDNGTYSYTYDRTGNVTQVTGPTGITAKYGYDPAGNLLTLNTAGNTTTYAYDGRNRVTRITDALGGQTSYTYDKGGNVTEITYGDGATYTYCYDSMGRVTGVKTPAGLSVKSVYDTEGQILSETATDMTAMLDSGATGGENRRTNAYEYDPLGNVTAVTDAMGGKTVYTYDALSRVTKATSPMGAESTFTYDSLGNLTAFTDAEDNTTTYTYDAKGRLTGKNTADEERYTYTYDSRDRLTAVEGEGSLVTYRYDAASRLTAVTDPNGSTTAYEYDKAGNLIKTLDPLGNRKQYTYDESGNLSEVTDENGTTTQYDYDALNRLVAKDTGETLSTATYAYDAMGRLTETDDVTGQSLYTYDEAGRLLTAADGNGRKLTYEYDAYGNVTKVIYPDGKTVTYTYDALNRMTSVTTAEGKTTRYEYDKDGNMTKAVREDGETVIAYDKLGRITGLANTSGGQLLSVYGYAYDGRGNIVREETGMLKEGTLWESSSDYTYDGKSQLVQAVLQEEGETPVTTAYVYDPAGNRLQMRTEKDGDTLTVDYTYDEAGRLIKTTDSKGGETTYEYDKAGNLITETGTGVETEPALERHYLYDAAGRLTAVTDRDTLLLAALYDGKDNRTFVMEYQPELKTPAANTAAETTNDSAAAGSSRRKKADGAQEQTYVQSTEGTEPAQKAEEESNGAAANGGNLNGTEKGNGSNAFWYGVLCQAADIILPSPTPFKAWLHEKIGFTDSITVLWEEAPYGAELSARTKTVREAGSPFALIENIFSDTSVTDLAADAYRQVNYVNDTNCADTRVLMEYAQNGGMGTSTTAYSYGVQRESYTMTQNALFAGSIPSAGSAIADAVCTGTYYYTGTGSVANLVSGGNGASYTYAAGGARTAYAMNAAGNTTAGNTAAAGNASESAPQAGATYENYGYNGEYTHENLGIQYLRARYYSMETGTFTSKDTYAGKLTDILSQNRYTYAENNPVTFADPSGHAKTKSGLSSLQDNIRKANGGNGPALKPAVNNPTAAAKAAYQSRRDAMGLPKENTLLDNIRIYNGKEYYNDLLAQVPLDVLLKSKFSTVDFAESVASRVELVRCAVYGRCKNASQEKIVEGSKKGEAKYLIYYLNNIDGAKSFGHNAILFVNRVGTGEFYSYMGGGENLWQTITQKTGGYFWHGHMNENELYDFLRTGDINVQMGNGQINFDNYDRALMKEISPKEYRDAMLRAEKYEKNPPAYQLFTNNCDDVSIEIIGNLAENVDMIEILPNNSFYLRSQVWEDWQFISIGKNSMNENIFEIPGGYYILRGLFGR